MAAREMAAPRRAAASSAEEGGAWGFSLVMVIVSLLFISACRECGWHKMWLFFVLVVGCLS